jgi:membrane protease YdiL (CAAX protease family)
MNPVGIVRRFPLLSFVLLACLFGWSPYLVTFLTGGSGAENLPLGPLLATLVVVSCQGREELRSWGRLIRSWRAPPNWYVLALIAPVALQLLIVATNHGFGAPLPTSEQLADWPQVPVTFLTMLVFVGIGEEAGWTAFAAPILLRRHRLLVAWALASAMRIFWHLPLMIGGELPWVLGTVGNAAFTLVTLQLLMASDGRWSLVAVWHAALNATGGLFFFTMVSGADRGRLGYLLAGVYAVAATAAHVGGGRHLTLREDPSPAGETRDNKRSAGPAPSGAGVIGAGPRRTPTGGSHED